MKNQIQYEFKVLSKTPVLQKQKTETSFVANIHNHWMPTTDQ